MSGNIRMEFSFIRFLFYCTSRCNACDSSWLVNLVGAVEEDVGLPLLVPRTVSGKDDAILWINKIRVLCLFFLRRSVF